MSSKSNATTLAGTSTARTAVKFANTAASAACRPRPKPVRCIGLGGHTMPRLLRDLALSRTGDGDRNYFLIPGGWWIIGVLLAVLTSASSALAFGLKDVVHRAQQLAA